MSEYYGTITLLWKRLYGKSESEEKRFATLEQFSLKSLQFSCKNRIRAKALHTGAVLASHLAKGQHAKGVFHHSPWQGHGFRLRRNDAG
jgi:hypothetical protein